MDIYYTVCLKMSEKQPAKKRLVFLFLLRSNTAYIMTAAISCWLGGVFSTALSVP